MRGGTFWEYSSVGDPPRPAWPLFLGLGFRVGGGSRVLFLLWCGLLASWLFLGFSWLPGFLVFWLLGFLASWFLASWLFGFLASWLFGFWQQHRELLHLAVAAAADAAAGDPCHEALNLPKPEKFT